jgi:dipeptidase D
MTAEPYTGLEPPEIWRHFAALNAIPRRPGHEAAAAEYVRGVAAAAGAECMTDARGNVLVRSPATARASSEEVVAVQCHLDMICESAPGVEHDFDSDPIVPRRLGEDIFASETTLGADNGIGVAAALALLTEPTLLHGPLELLFTVEEEIGLLGALHFDVSLLAARRLINLDSEDDEALTIGSAGGAEVQLTAPLRRERMDGERRCAELSVSGLTGGHSGVQIHEHRANAIKLLASALGRLLEGDLEAGICSLVGGSAHNAIPREAVARVAIAPDAIDRAAEIVAALGEELEREWGEDEPGLSIALRLLESAPPASADHDASAALVALLEDLPHGVIAMSSRFEGTVATSANLALVQSESESIEILSSVRSLSATELEETTSRICQLAARAGSSARLSGGYPGWEPKADSPLLGATTTAYEHVHAHPPRIEIVHGGLECGVFVSRKADLEAVSFGPLIMDAHTPREHVRAASVASTWQVLVTLLGELAAPNG